jgi:hypothetical protein
MFDCDITIKYGTRANHATNAKPSVKEAASIAADSSIKRNLI